MFRFSKLFLIIALSLFAASCSQSARAAEVVAAVDDETLWATFLTESLSKATPSHIYFVCVGGNQDRSLKVLPKVRHVQARLRPCSDDTTYWAAKKELEDTGRDVLVWRLSLYGIHWVSSTEARFGVAYYLGPTYAEDYVVTMKKVDGFWKVTDAHLTFIS